MKEYVIYIDKVNTSEIIIPAQNKKEAIKIAERFIKDLNNENADIKEIIEFDSHPNFKVRTKGTCGSAFFIGDKNDS